jgi:hypothetical protein
MQSLSSQELMAICDGYWIPRRAVDHGRFVLAHNELATCGPEIRDWCRGLLTHSDYDARECGAFLLGQLGGRGRLGGVVDAVVAELGALIRRPVEEDGKEAQAIDAAIGALAEIGSPAGVSHLRSVLRSEDEFLLGDTQWSAAEALGRLVGQPFTEAADPVGAARAWLASHREA